MLTVESANVRTLAPKQETGMHASEPRPEQLGAGVCYQVVVAAASENGSYGV